MSQKLNGGGRERASQVPDLHFKICNLGSKSALFLPKTALEPAESGQKKGNSGCGGVAYKSEETFPRAGLHPAP